MVGRITGMVDCKWEKKGLGIRDWGLEKGSGTANHKSLVALGDKFILSSGLMEITCHTGAKVILQGPVTFDVEANGGYLAVGKLTGKLEKRGERREERGEGTANHQSSIINHQSSNPFVIRTPTATVTDLGTEFGVEVDRSGVTDTHVFRGVVRVQVESAPGGDPNASHAVELKENESIRVEKASATDSIPRIAFVRKAAEPERFMRTLPRPQEPSRLKVLAYFRMGEDDLGAVAGKPAASETVDDTHRCRFPMKKFGSPTYAAETAAPGSSLAMNFSGADGEYFFSRYVCWTPSDNIILETWVRPMPSEEQLPMYVVYSGNGNTDGYGIQEIRREWYCFLGGGFGWMSTGVRCELGKWTHLAFVCERGNLQFWVNGRLVKFWGDSHVLIPSRGPLTIGGAPEHIGSKSQRPFIGQIDEVRLSEFRGSFNPNMLLVPPASPATMLGELKKVDEANEKSVETRRQPLPDGRKGE